jgi:hypothetical protein
MCRFIPFHCLVCLLGVHFVGWRVHAQTGYSEKTDAGLRQNWTSLLDRIPVDEVLVVSPKIHHAVNREMGRSELFGKWVGEFRGAELAELIERLRKPAGLGVFDSAFGQRMTFARAMPLPKGIIELEMEVMDERVYFRMRTEDAVGDFWFDDKVSRWIRDRLISINKR